MIAGLFKLYALTIVNLRYNTLANRATPDLSASPPSIGLNADRASPTRKPARQGEEPTLPRNPSVFTPADADALEVSPWAFDKLAGFLARVLAGQRLMPAVNDSAHLLPKLRAVRFVGRRNGAFATTDDLLLFLLRYYVLGRSQRQLADEYGKTQVCLSQWLKRAKPYWLTVLRYCTYYGPTPRVRMVSKVMGNSAELSALYEALRAQRGPLYPSFLNGEALPLWPYRQR